MERIKALRGFRDITGEEIERFRAIERVSREAFELFGFKEIELPILERTELFVRSIGDATDIVEKEMFTFTDKAGESITMRPEATAGVVRFYLQEGLYAKERVSKLFTIGPMFRYERPQKGRFREFHQIDVEVFGVAGPLIEAELLWMVSSMLKRLGIDKDRYRIEVNSVGCNSCRESFRGNVVTYFSKRKEDLCEDCQRRLERNPLRIFDCKNDKCIEISRGAPLIADSLCDECEGHLEAFLRFMGSLDLSVVVNKRLVRGLDYYTKTVFEVISMELGAQNAFIAGGRYDNLVKEMGGPDVPGIGFAIGMERLSMLIAPIKPNTRPFVFFAWLGERAYGYIMPLMKAFTDNGVGFFYSYEVKSLKSQMRYADSINSAFVLIIGDEEIDKGIAILRDMRAKTQYKLPIDIPGLVKEVSRHIVSYQATP